MLDLLESGKLRISPEAASAYRAAADRLHETCEIALDLTQPIRKQPLRKRCVQRSRQLGGVKGSRNLASMIEKGLFLHSRWSASLLVCLRRGKVNSICSHQITKRFSVSSDG